MRAPPALALVVVAAVASGCTAGFPGSSRVVTEFEVGELAPGQVAIHDFSLAEAADALVVGFRTGPAQHLHVLLRAPDGTRYDTMAADPPGGCAVRGAVAGTWGLEVGADGLDGELRGGKFTVRAVRGGLPAIYPCSDDVAPGRGRSVTLAGWNVTLAPGENATLPFDQPLELVRLDALLLPRLPEASANATANATANLTDPVVASATANATLTLVSPDGLPAGAMVSAPARGRWSLVVAVPASEAMTLEARVAVQGIGA